MKAAGSSQKNEDLAALSDTVRSFDHQVAGHTKQLIRRYGEGFILKPQNKSDLFEREVETYEKLLELFQNKCPFFAKYYGVLYPHTVKALQVPCLLLEDLTSCCCRPSVIDIKIGQQTYEPTASEEKICRERLKYPMQSEIGFRITGMKVWDVLTQKYFYCDKHFGRSLQEHQILDALTIFFSHSGHVNLNLIRACHAQLLSILSWMERQTYFTFYCSSILIVYDTPENQTENYCKVCMIDFAHVIHSAHNEGSASQGLDLGYLHGLRNLISKLEKMETAIAYPSRIQPRDFQKK